ncbi:MAG: sugar phosphate isomerase/epimerase [bacterium]|nr:sugar phosphate isomerase/epimerase [bacterium]
MKAPDVLLFPKFQYPHLREQEQLADHLIDCGFDGVDVMIRTGSWCKEEDYFHTLPAFVNYMRGRNLKAYTVTTDWSHDHLAKIEDDFRLFADNGITMFRFWMQNYRGYNTYREDLARCRQSVETVEKLGLKYGVKALLQTHGGGFCWSPEAIYFLIHDRDPKGIGVHYDPGNMVHQEGWTDPVKSLDILQEHLAYVVTKNCGWFLGPNLKQARKLTWKMEWTRLAEGLIDWPAILGQLVKIDYQGPICTHHFYEGTLEALTEGTKDDLNYLRGLLGKIRG